MAASPSFFFVYLFPFDFIHFRFVPTYYYFFEFCTAPLPALVAEAVVAKVMESRMKLFHRPRANTITLRDRSSIKFKLNYYKLVS